MSVCALVVTYNRRALLEECLRAIEAQTVRPDELILVDNASTDGTRELLREGGYLDRPDVTYLRLDENLGSSGGFARGFEAARESGPSGCGRWTTTPSPRRTAWSGCSGRRRPASPAPRACVPRWSTPTAR